MKRALWIIAVGFSALALDMCVAFFRWQEFSVCPPGSTPSSLTFAYTDLRPGSTQSCLSSSQFSGFSQTKVELPFTPTPAMLLYWDGRAKPLGSFSGKRVLIGQSYPAGVYAYDIDSHKVLWHHEFLPKKLGQESTMPINSSAPVIDEKFQRVYGTFIEEKFVGKKPTDSRLTQHYFSLKLSGEDPEELSVDLSKFVLGPGTTATPEDVNKYIRCRAALGVNHLADQPFVYSGCSIVRAFSYLGANFVHHESSQSVKGIRGLLLALPVNSNSGRFEKSAFAFVPSRVGPIAGAGVDAGIWLSGGAPTLLPGNQILLTTGNGIYRPDLGVYGCAMVKLSGSTLQPVGSYFSKKDKSVEEAAETCHKGNLDPSSSAVAVLREGEKYYAAYGGKDGWIKMFDPATFSGEGSIRVGEAQVVEGLLFGQPIAFPGALFAIGGNSGSGVLWSGFSVGGDFHPRRLWNVTDSHPRAFNSSATGTYRDKGEGPLLLVPLASGTPAQGFPSALQAVDARNGQVLSETPFQGAVHFSMPTVVDDRVFVPTAEHGIYEFVAIRSFKNFILYHSLSGRILRSLR